MSKKYFLLGTCLMLCTFANAQRMVTIDFLDTAKDPVINVNNIKQGDYYRIKIKNINQNLFKVSLTSADTVLSQPQQTPTFGKVGLDELSKVIAGISPLTTTVTQEASWQALTETLSSSSDKMLLIHPTSFVSKAVKDTINIELERLSNAKLSVEWLAARIDSLKLQVYKLKLYSLRLANRDTTFDFTNALKAVENIRDSISALTADLTKKKKSYEAFSGNNKAAIEKDTELSSADGDVKKAYDKLLTALSELQTSVSADKTYELLSQLVFIENNIKNTYISLPIQFMGEQSKVQLSITPRDEKYNLQSYYTQIVFPQNIKPYTVVGLSFYGSNLHDKAYSTIKTMINDSTASYSFKEEDLTKAEVGVAALLRFGTKFKNSDKFGIHGSIGAGVSLSNKIKPRVLFGGGFSYGKKHMFAVDLGGILGYVDRLSSAIDLSQAYLEKPETITVSKLRIGVFASIGYVYQF